MQKFCSNLKLTFGSLDIIFTFDIFSGMYSCHATNKEGEGNSNSVSLFVQCKYWKHYINPLFIKHLCRYPLFMHIFFLILKYLPVTINTGFKKMCFKWGEEHLKVKRRCDCVFKVVSLWEEFEQKVCGGHSSLFAWQTLNLKLALVPHTVGMRTEYKKLSIAWPFPTNDRV